MLNFNDNIFICVGMVIFAILGACVKWLNIKKNTTTTFAILGIEAATAAFTGILIYCIYIWLQFDEGLAFAFTGLAGFYGTKGIGLIGKCLVYQSKINGWLPPSEEFEEKNPE